VASTKSNHQQGMIDSIVSSISRVLDVSHPNYPSPSAFPWKALKGISEKIYERKWTAFLVGGAVRDLVISRGTQPPRDIDIVVGGARVSELLEVFRDAELVRFTRFGGLRLKYLDAFVDIWPIDETRGVGRKQPADIADIPKYAFLDVEAVAIEICPNVGTKRQLVESGFINAVISGTLEINYESNPFPEISVFKALRTSQRLNLGMGPGLVEYIQRKRLDSHSLFAAQRSHYGEVLWTQEEIEWRLEAVRIWDTKGGCLNLGSAAFFDRNGVRYMSGSFVPVSQPAGRRKVDVRKDSIIKISAKRKSKRP
jgi:hypothetical protein